MIIVMPDKDNNILKYNHGEKSMKAPFIIYADMESLLEKKKSICHNNPNKLSKTKINKHTPSGCLMFTPCPFDNAKNSLNHYRVQDRIKMFCKDLKEHATKMVALLDKEKKSYKNQKSFLYMQKKRFSSDDDNKEYYKVMDHCYFAVKYRGAAHNICNLRCKKPKKIPVVFHNGSNYDIIISLSNS